MKIKQFQQLMKERNIDMYIVPTSDFHDSEYVSQYFQTREFLSGFTGSAGTMVVTRSGAVLFTDGRYFIQAENELAGTDIHLMKMGEIGVPTLFEYIEETIGQNQTIGFDGRVVGYEFGQMIEEIVKKKDGRVQSDEDLVDYIWTDRPELEFHGLMDIDEAQFGETYHSKLLRVRTIMKELGANIHVLTSLDDIAWLFNIRGSDVECNPVVFAYAVITLEEAYLFVNKKIFTKEIEGVNLKDYDAIYQYPNTLKNIDKVLLDNSRVNYTIANAISKKAKVIDGENPTSYFKSIKNKVEIEHTKRAHILDGVAVTKFMYWLKNNIGKQQITELSASEYLENLRRKHDTLFGLSFHTISAYNSNAAMMHYSADAHRNAELKAEGMLLVDSGGQYYDGTTDITRTFILGAITAEMKIHFTAVVRSMLRLSNAKFLYGCKGINLDILARGPLWDLGIDYKCGTGHGVGHVLNVHEGPNSFRWKSVSGRSDGAVLEEGMITTDEPGVYIQGSHGIRIENELLCVKGIENNDGQFMEFETLTFAPIDLDGIDRNYLNKEDIDYLNKYHALVYDKISPYLDEKERVWLKEYTQSI